MSKIDRFLSILASRGGVILRFNPTEPVIMELPGGHRQMISNQEMLGTILDGLAKEIVPEELSTLYMRGERVTFDYSFENTPYQVVCTRSRFGSQIIIARLNAASPAPAAKPEPVGHNEDSSFGATGLGRLEPYLRHLLNQGGSDLYLSADELPAIRKDGVVSLTTELPVQNGLQMAEFLKSWMPAANWEAFQNGLDTEFAFTPQGLVYRLRVRVFHDHQGPTMALRVIPRLVPDSETLGLSDPIRRLAHLNKGLVILAGPAGSGKTTTQACLVDIANHGRKAFVLSVLDSVEFEFPSGTCLIRQREVGRDLVRQKRAMRAALQMDPDILVLGELRDRECIDLALQAAQMGRLVLAQVTGASLMDTLYSLEDAYPPDQRAWFRSRLADHLKALLVHTLLLRPGGGRVAAVETLFNNPNLAGHLREGRLDQIPTAMKSGRYGQVSHNEALIRLIQSQGVDPMEAYQRCQDRDSFITACKKAGIVFDPRAEGQITEQ